MKPAETIKHLLENMNVTPDPEKDRQMLEAILRAQVQSNNQPPADSKPGIWRIMMHNKLTKPIAAMIIFIAAFLGLTLFEKTLSPVYAVEQTVQAMQAVENLRLTIANGPKQMQMIMRINPQTGYADYIRMDNPDSGNVTITVPGQTYIYNHQKNEVMLLGQEILTNDLNFKDVINSVIEQTQAADGRLEILNQFNELAGKEVISVTIIRKDESMAGQFLIDPETNLPIYFGIDAGGQLNYMGPIEYNVPIPDDAFEFDIPENAAVNDQRPEELKSAAAPGRPVDYNVLETAAALLSARNVHGIWIDRQGRRVESWGLLNPADGTVTKARLEYEDGGLYIMANGKTYFEDSGMKAVKDGSYFNVGVIFKDFITLAAQRIGSQGVMTVEKQFSDEFQRDVIHVDAQLPWVQLQTVVDIDTKRPIKFSIPMTTDPTEPLDYTELIEYDVDLPPNFFDFKTGPDVLVLGEHLDVQFCKDPNYGMPYDDAEDVQQVCQTIAKRYLQAKIDRDIDTIKQLHPIHINRCGSNKMIENAELEEISWNGKIVEILDFKAAYEYHPRQMMVPCRVIKEKNGQRQEVTAGVIVYLREHAGQKSAVITGYYPLLKGKFKVTPEGAELAAVTYEGLEPNAWMQNWLVMGPLSIPADQAAQHTAFETTHINPGSFEPTINFEGKPYQWRLLSNESGPIDLSRPFGTLMGIIYLWAQVEMPKQTALVLGIGSDDGVKVWLNGELVHENWVSRGMTTDNDHVPVTFQKGTNHLVLKIQNQGGGPWGFCCRRLEE